MGFIVFYALVGGMAAFMENKQQSKQDDYVAWEAGDWAFNVAAWPYTFVYKRILAPLFGE